MVGVPVVVSLTDVHEGSVVAQSQQPQTDPVEDVDHARDARVLTEGDHPPPGGVTHRLVVHTAHVLLQHGVQQVHVVGLRLDGVGEETEGLVGDERVNGNLLHPEDTGCFSDVLLYLGSNIGVGGHGVGSPAVIRSDRTEHPDQTDLLEGWTRTLTPFLTSFLTC